MALPDKLLPKKNVNKLGSGIYLIYCAISDKIYIGQSKNIGARLKNHKSNLNRNTHANVHLQHSWNKHGPDSFIFLPIENCNEEKLSEREFYFLSLVPVKRRYNLLAITTNSYVKRNNKRTSPRKGVILSDETKEKISSSLKSNHIEVERAKSNCLLMNSDPDIIKKRTEARKQNYRISDETRKKLSESTKEYWRLHNMEKLQFNIGKSLEVKEIN